MRLFMLLLVFGCFSALISSRPTVEGNESETSDAEEEGSEDSEEDEYLSDGQESPRDEAINQDGMIEDSQAQNLNIRNNKNNIDYRTFSEIEPDNKKEQDLNKLINSNLLREKSLSVEMGRPNTYNDESNNAAEPNEESVLKRNDHQRLESRNVNSGSLLTADYSGAVGGDNINERLSPNKQHNSMQQYYKRVQTKNKNLIDGRKYDYSCNARDRRDAQSFKSEKSTENNNENSENAILKNIKKLSDQDLEQLLDSLPEDKKDLLRKIMDKREITKKAGAVDDNNGLEQSDTSKVEEHYSEDSNSNSGFSSNTDTSEAKHSDGEETSTKTPENEQASGKSENKIGFDANSNIEALEVSIEAVTSNVDAKKQDAKIVSKETNKNDNKREINTDIKVEKILQDAEAKFDDDLNSKNTYDFSLDQTAIDADNSDLFESKNGACNAQKREVSQLDSETLSDSVKALEDSFPSGNAYEDTEFDMEPLIRVKRTKLEHRVEKRDLPQLNDKVQFVRGDDEENIEGSEFKDNTFSDHSPTNKILQNDKDVETQENQNSDKQQQFSSKIIKNSKLHDVEDKSSLGSDTDNVLSSIEGIDENIMYNNKARNKRFMKENNTVKLTRNGRTIHTITNNDNNSITGDCLNGHQYESQESFGAVLQNSEEDLTRFKRI